MARRHYSSIRPRDRAWLNDAIDRNRALELAFHCIAGSDKTMREELRRACLQFLFVYENFSANRKRTRTELLHQQERIDVLHEQTDVLIDRSSARRRGDLSSDTRYREFAALREAILLAEKHLISDRALAGMAGYLARKDLPLNAALLKLIEVAGDRDAEVAALAEALLNQHVQKIDGKAILETVVVAAERVRNVRRACGFVVRGKFGSKKST
jgi:hypothetical protein